MNCIAVFCGSNFGRRHEYRAAAEAFGALLASRRITLVYGGTTKGLMGVVADAVLSAGGNAVGVITRQLYARNHLHGGLTRYEIANDMRSRKARMSEMADAFVALPGGMGTFEELFEAATLCQLGEQRKPCGALDVLGFFRPLRALLENATAENFLKAEHRDMLLIDSDPATLLDRLGSWQAPTVTKWIDQPGS